MTQKQFTDLFEKGDANAAWAAVENHTAGEVTSALAKKESDLAAIKKAHDQLRSERDQLKALTKPARIEAAKALRNQLKAQLDKTESDLADLAK